MGLACPKCSAIRTSDHELKIHLSIAHGGWTETEWREVQNISVPTLDQILETLEQVTQLTEAVIFVHLERCQHAGTWIKKPNAEPIPTPAPDDCSICKALSELLSDLWRAKIHAEKSRAADLEKLASE